MTLVASMDAACRESHAVGDSGPLAAPRTQALLLCLLCLGTFAAGLSGGFVLDDNHVILGHPAVQGSAPLFEVFTRTFWGAPLGANPPAYRPLATLSFALDQRLFGGSALAFHLSSLLCYMGLVLAGWAFARRCMAPGAALLAMAIFTVMPVHVENVSSLVGRADVLGALMGLLALLALSPSIVEGKATSLLRLGLAALAFSAGLWCKESVAVLPMVVALFVEYQRRRLDAPLPILRRHLPSLTLLACLGVYFAARLSLQPGTFAYIPADDVLRGADLWVKAGYGFELLARYLRLVVVPVGLCTGHKYAEVFRPAQLSLTMALGAGLLGLVGYLSWRAYRRRGLPFVASAFLAWLLVAGLLFSMPESMADRFLLLPSLFLCLSLGPALQFLWNSNRGIQVLLLAVLGVQVVLSNLQARTWHDEGALWSHAVQACPDSVHNHFRYAEYLADRGQSAEAVWHYAVASRGEAAYPFAWSHPAREEEQSLPANQRVRDMHRLLHVQMDEREWRTRFQRYLASQGRGREAALVAGRDSTARR